MSLTLWLYQCTGHCNTLERERCWAVFSVTVDQSVKCPECGGNKARLICKIEGPR